MLKLSVLYEYVVVLLFNESYKWKIYSFWDIQKSKLGHIKWDGIQNILNSNYDR